MCRTLCCFLHVYSFTKIQRLRDITCISVRPNCHGETPQHSPEAVPAHYLRDHVRGLFYPYLSDLKVISQNFMPSESATSRPMTLPPLPYSLAMVTTAGTFLRSSGRILHFFTGDIQAYQRSVPERFCFFSQLICSFSGHFQPDADIQAGRQSFFFENRRIRWVPARPPQIRPTGKEISDTLKNFLSDDILIFIFIMSEESRKR